MHKPPPDGWLDHRLTQYLDTIRDNQFASFHQDRTRPWAIKMIEIDEALDEILRDWSGSALTDFDSDAKQVATMLLYRSHGAYRAASSLALAGAVSDAYPSLRLAIECAAYFMRAIDSDDAFRAWLHRDHTPASIDRCRKQFAVKKLRWSFRRRDPFLEMVYFEIYGRSITYGAHPNVNSVLSGAKVGGDADTLSLTSAYLQGGTIEQLTALKSVCQGGLFTLICLQHEYPTRVDDVGVTERIEGFKKGL